MIKIFDPKNQTEIHCQIKTGTLFELQKVQI
jgi:hypothetical protein